MCMLFFRLKLDFCRVSKKLSKLLFCKSLSYLRVNKELDTHLSISLFMHKLKMTLTLINAKFVHNYVTFLLVPWETFENAGMLSKIVKNINLTIWEKVFFNFIRLQRLNQDRYGASQKQLTFCIFKISQEPRNGFLNRFFLLKTKIHM